MEINSKTEVTIAELAVVLGLTSRRVRQLAQDGIISAAEKGKYRLGDAVQAYIEFRAKEKAMTKEEVEKLTAETSIKKAKAVIAVMEAKELQGKMHRSEDVQAITEDFIYTVRGILTALPGRLAVDVSAASTPADAAEIIRKEVYRGMEELSQYRYDPKKYEERVRERQNWDAHERNVEDDSEV